MATAHGPGWAATDASPVRSLHDSPHRHRPPLDSTGSHHMLAHETSIYSDVRPTNPRFVFPSHPSSPRSAPASYSRASGRRPLSAIEPRNVSPSPPSEDGDMPRRAVALPAFSFNPGASLLPDPDPLTLLSPPLSPSSSSKPFPSPSRPARHGHRRGGSEFVGGSIRDGNSIAIMSTSPTKSESGLASPGLPPPTRGHRRGVSGAILPSELPPLPDFVMPKGSSAPSSPSASDLKQGAPIPVHDEPPKLPESVRAWEPSKHASNAAPDAILPSTLAFPAFDVENGSPRRARTRVGFSDKLEFIPRPLSLVSSDTSSTATARPGHSVSGSISSIVSAVASPCGRESPVPLSRTATGDLNEYRPSTAGAILERTTDIQVGKVPSNSPRRRNSIPMLLGVADAQATGQVNASPSAKSSKRWSFFGLEPAFMSSPPPTKQRPSSSSSSESASRAASAASSSDHESDSTETGKEATSCTARKAGKRRSRKKRVKGWAGSILPLKPRGHKKRPNLREFRPPTPPGSVGPLEDEDVAVDEAEMSGAEPPLAQVSMAECPTVSQDGFNQRPRSRDDASYPMIDLDAALGPFNTPLPHNAEWEAAQRAAGSAGKRRMHSAQMMKGFSGPGMHYHRRAESAPDLPPFDPGRSGIPRFSSNSTMADVFEEDEEDEKEDDDVAESQNGFGDGEATPPATVPAMDGTTTAIVGSGSSETAFGAIRRRTSSGPSEAEQSAAHAVRMECSMTSLHDEVITEEPPSIILCSANVQPHSGPDSATPSPTRLSGARELWPVEINAASIPISPYSTSHASSSHPSPLSPMSMDAQRISTAPSSLTDKNSFQSLLMGEPGPEVRISADYDIRSLTSSNSTMTRDSSFIPNQRMSQPSLREQRPVSVSSAAFGRRRSSLVSLSRLIASSHGERSKLSMEMTLDNESESKKSKKSKGSKTRRLGRVMQFWKPSKEEAPKGE